MRKLSASDRSALIKLASSLPAGSPERRTILAETRNKIVNGGFRFSGLTPEQLAFINIVLRAAADDLRRANVGASFSGFSSDKWQSGKPYQRDAFGGKSVLAGKPHALIDLGIEFFSGDKYVGRFSEDFRFILAQDGSVAVIQENLYGMRSTKAISAKEMGDKLGDILARSGTKHISNFNEDEANKQIIATFPPEPSSSEILTALNRAGFNAEFARSGDFVINGHFHARFHQKMGIKKGLTVGELNHVNFDVRDADLFHKEIGRGSFPILDTTAKNVNEWIEQISRIIRSGKTASDRSALIKLASTLPSGSPERRAILAGLQHRQGPRVR